MIAAVDIVGTDFKRDSCLPFMVEVKLDEPTSNSFLKVMETLTRIGIHANDHDNPECDTLYQTCHILNKRGKVYIVHFKTMFALDGRDNNLTPGDIARQNRIIQLLSDWKLVTVVNPSMIVDQCSMSNIKIVSHSDKINWNLVPKYDIGAKIRKQYND